MTPEQAISIITELADKAPMVKKDHDLVYGAINVLKEAIIPVKEAVKG